MRVYTMCLYTQGACSDGRLHPPSLSLSLSLSHSLKAGGGKVSLPVGTGARLEEGGLPIVGCDRQNRGCVCGCVCVGGGGGGGGRGVEDF